MKTIIIGSGGREYVLGWKLRKDNFSANDIIFIPGNGGTSQIGRNKRIDTTDFDKIAEVVEKEDAEIVIIGPEQPLAGGLADLLHSKFPALKIVGPDARAAKLESSKAFAKNFMKKHNIPTANYQSFTKNEKQSAIDFLKKLSPPYVLKADGLAAGKGVMIINDFQRAVEELNNMFDGKFGKASETIVIEEFLNGIELSVFILTDGENYKILPTSKDYKRIGENDTGLNTGGMGAVSPVPFADDGFMQKIEKKIIKRTLQGLKNEGIVYKGFLYFGLMKVNDEPYVIEYNVRMGDPETQVVIPRIDNFAEIIVNFDTEKFKDTDLKINPKTAVTVVLASGGYPEKYEKGKEINGIEKLKNAFCFHAGTILKENRYYTNGGRVLNITAFGDNIELARQNVYAEIQNISFENMYFRKDIGFDLIKN